jgi:hypothetical protein
MDTNWRLDMIDSYSKTVLTVIAIALCLNVWATIKPVHQAHAQAQMQSCTKESPCWMALYEVRRLVQAQSLAGAKLLTSQGCHQSIRSAA